MNETLTGRTRFRSLKVMESYVLILQVEYRLGSGPVSGWRDARVEDLRGKEVEVRT